MAGVADAVVGNAAGWANVADTLAQTRYRDASTQSQLIDALTRGMAIQSQMALRQTLAGQAPNPVPTPFPPAVPLEGLHVNVVQLACVPATRVVGALPLAPAPAAPTPAAPPPAAV